MSRYVLSPRARADLDDIWVYSAQRWGTDQAEDYIRRVQRAIETVAQEPRRGRACDEIRRGYWKYPAGSGMSRLMLKSGRRRCRHECYAALAV